MRAYFRKDGQAMRASVRSGSTESKVRLLYLGNDLELISTLRKALGCGRDARGPGTRKRTHVLVSCSDRESAIMFLKSDIPYQLLLIDFEWREREGLKLASLARLLKHRKRMPTVLVTRTELSRRLKVPGPECRRERVRAEDAGHGRDHQNDPAIERVVGVESIERRYPC